MPNLPRLTLPRETDEYIGPLLTITWDGEPTTDVEIGVTSTRPDTAFAAYPGGKVPTVTGTYLIQVRRDGIVRDLGYLIIT